ncbi:MAG: hypothetical protein AAF447_03105 [Myxococcota bacterium]
MPDHDERHADTTTPEPPTRPGLHLPKRPQDPLRQDPPRELALADAAPGASRRGAAPSARDDIDDLTRATLRFLGSVDADLLTHPLVQGAGRCDRCGALAPDAAVLWRRRRIVELLIAIETETFSRLTHGLVFELTLPPHVICGHVPTLPLPAWEGPGGTVYYARRPRPWKGRTETPGRPEPEEPGMGAADAPERERASGPAEVAPPEPGKPDAAEPTCLLADETREAPVLDPPVVVFSRAPMDEVGFEARPDPEHLAEALAFLDEPVTVVGRSPTHHPEARRKDGLPRPDLAWLGLRPVAP